MTELSIVIPVYNVERYLGECLDSILCQDCSGVEVLLINDGSKDSSGVICDDYARRNTQIRVFHKQNEGVSIARNLGIEHAKGRWVSFVDPDDYIGTEYCSFFQGIKDQAYDLVFFSLAIVSNFGQHREKAMEDKVYDGDKNMQRGIVRLMRNSENCEFFGFTVNKFFKRDILLRNHIRFVEGLTYREDELFTLDYCRHISNFYTSSKVLYYYRYDIQGSLSHKKKPIREIVDYYDCFLEKTGYLTDYDVKCMEYDRALHLLINAYSPDLTRDELELVHSRISNLLKEKKHYLKGLKKTKLFSLVYSFPSLVSHPIMELFFRKVYTDNLRNSNKDHNDFW